jgi:hypothetical protein
MIPIVAKPIVLGTDATIQVLSGKLIGGAAIGAGLPVKKSLHKTPFA